jgi:hypothetical protein
VPGPEPGLVEVEDVTPGENAVILSASRVGSGATATGACFLPLLLALLLLSAAVGVAVGLCSGLFGREGAAPALAVASAARPAAAVKNVKLLSSIARNKFIKMIMPSTSTDRK